MFTILHNDLAALRTEIDKLNRKADKFGWAKTVISQISTPKLSGGVVTVDVELEVGKQAFEGWTAVAERSRGGFGTFYYQRVPVPAYYGNADAEEYNCEHCCKNRQRNTVFFFKHEDGTFAKVGSTCLKDFFNVPHIENYAAYLQSVASAVVKAEDKRSNAEKSAGMIEAYKTLHFVAACFHVSQTTGFVPKSAGNECTAAQAVSHLNKSFPGLSVGGNALSNAEKAIDWIKKSASDSFTRELAELVSCDFVNLHSIYKVAYLIALYAKAHEVSVSKHFGTVGERVKGLVVKFESCKAMDSVWGLSYLVKGHTLDGNVVSFFAKEPVLLAVNKIDGTLKGHEVYGGVNTTIFNRVKILM